MNQVRQSYYIRESAISTQPQGNSFVNSRNNSGVNIQHQGSLGLGTQTTYIANNSIQTTQPPQGQTSSSVNPQYHHQKQQSYASNHSLPKNQYIINLTQDSSLMTVADANNQRKSLSILTTQQSQLKELFRNKAQTPNHYHTNSISQQSINAPYLKDNYLLRNNDNTNQSNQSGYFSRSKINKNKFISLGDSDQKRRQSSTLLGQNVQNDYVISDQKQHSNFYHKQASSHSHIKVVDSKNSNDSDKNFTPQSKVETISKEQSRLIQLQQSYIQKLKNNKIVKQKSYQFQIFTNIVQNFLLNETLIDHTDAQIKEQLNDLLIEQSQQQAALEQRVNTESSASNQISKSSRNIIDTESDTAKINDNNFLKVLQQDNNSQQQNQNRRPSILQIMQQKYTHTQLDFNSSNQEDTKAKVQFITEQTTEDQTTQKSTIKQDNNKLVINVINSQNELAKHDFANSTRAIKIQQNQINNSKSDLEQEVTSPADLKQKEDILMFLMDFLNKIEHQFLEGINCKYYPQEDFIKQLMKNLMELSNKICHYLMQRKEKVASIFINTILKVFAQILEKQYLYVKDQVKQLVKIQVQEHNEKFNYYVNKKKELEDKISQMYKDQDKIVVEFQKKIVAMEEIKNQYLEQAEILREQIEESKTKKYKDYQLERIQVQSKEVIKNCAQIEAEILKRREDTKDSIQNLAKMTMEHFNTVKNDPRRRSLLGNLGFSGINQSDLILQGSMTHSENQQSFSEFNLITYAAKYDKPETKAAILFAHPFQFYIQQDIHNYMYDKLIPKQSRSEMIKLLENYMEEVTILKYGGNKINGPLNFLSWILQKHQNFFVASIKITEIAFLLQSLVNSKKEIGIYFATIFGIVQDNMLSDSQFEFMISIRKMLKLYIPWLDQLDTLKEQEINKMIDDQVFIPAKQVLESFQTVFKNHPQYSKIEERFQIFLKTRKVQINQRAIQEQRKIINSKFGESSLTLIPNLMEKMKTENINDVIRSLENIFAKLDQKQQEKVNYNSFKKLMYNHYGVDTENESISEYFSEFIFGEWFNYQGFIQKVIKLHVPDDVNDKLISYYSTMNEICNLLMHNQNQSFHEFKNRLSNYLFNMESLNFFQYNTIDEFFKSYENSKDDQLKFNTKRISPALLYQQLFKQNEFGQLYQYFKQSGSVDDENCEFIKRLYPQRILLDNFNEFLDYNRHIYQFLSVQEKIQIVQAPTPSETSIQYFNQPTKSNNNLKRLNTINKIKAAKLSKFTSQSSNVSSKSNSNQPQYQASRKSQFNLQQLTKSNTLIKQDTIQLERSDSKESSVSIATPASASKKSIFSGV
ncbi:hypothetical protein TTHERM_01114140 (macronuclear) [Tetrahymena thermophila SB210]|uniref:Uncharacterized protein n=1 Tax=Tetrahymena thermophila (strain SB210) TaxID=312017 RepID=Q24D37_TETTS|nr:hypothetical protein TTHERM_01114140 [Tetrahymena thermophila SB210]EAS05704.2 hypothetical protein TTHERM_01114140 [Tetrahymena thermophila SB210]|eukprot:XP_001025949.2 hypothetical protein TTHERM_01114140 [Tetrahymena thermophila SB210]